MRVLIPAIDFRAGGAERVLSWLARRLVEQGHDVTVLTWRPPVTDFYDLPVETIRYSVSSSSAETARPSLSDHVAYLRRLRSLARRNDIVISFLTDLNVYVLLATIGIGTPVVVSERLHPAAGEGRSIPHRLRPLVYRRRARLVVVQTDAVAAIARNDWGVSGVVTIPNPALAAPRPAARPDRAPVVLAVGRLVEQKDHATLIRAWATVNERFPEWSLRIAGEGVLLDDLTELAATTGVAASVTFLGRVDDVDAEYENAEIFAMSSVAEGFPNALVEAVSHDCACIATDCPGGSAEILLDGEGGLLVPPRAPDELARGLLSLIGDPSLRTRLRSAARAGLTRYDEGRVLGMWTAAINAAVTVQVTSGIDDTVPAAS